MLAPLFLRAAGLQEADVLQHREEIRSGDVCPCVDVQGEVCVLPPHQLRLDGEQQVQAPLLDVAEHLAVVVLAVPVEDGIDSRTDVIHCLEPASHAFF